MSRIDADAAREIVEERRLYTSGAVTEVKVDIADDRGMIFRVRFDRDQLEALFPALKEDENVIQFIRDAALDAARRRTSAANTEAAS